jgi:hypothetical protein
VEQAAPGEESLEPRRRQQKAAKPGFPTLCRGVREVPLVIANEEIDRINMVSELHCTLTPAIRYVKGDHLVEIGIHCNPNPLFCLLSSLRIGHFVGLHRERSGVLKLAQDTADKCCDGPLGVAARKHVLSWAQITPENI